MTEAPLRKILSLALPALVVLAAEPVYLLVDTAVVGHLGGTALASLAIGGGVLAVAAWIGNVLAFGTTAKSSRLYGAGRRAEAVAEGVQSSWLALAAGVLLAVAAQFGAGPLARAMAGTGEIADGAETWLRIASLGAPGILLALAGNGWMRGVQDTRRPVWYVLGANLLSAVLCPILVYPAGMGLTGSAVANVIAQTLSGGLFVWALVAEKVPLAPHPGMLLRQLTLSRDLVIRGFAFQASFLSAAAVAARFGAAALAAHQIALQLWMFCAFVLDALAVAAQSLIGAELGAGREEVARRTAWRITRLGGYCGVAFGVVIAASAWWLPDLFTGDQAVHQQAMIAWPWFVAMQPIAGVVFALDGVLVGAGDIRYMRNMTIVAALGGFLPVVWLAYVLDLGLGGVWAGLTVFMVVRLVALMARLMSGRWAVAGAVRA
ncbi:MATE family efflux transporter [Longispora albida]|uniref:MATE family efflux transporter n=1 Tax=Longispora albida TaxID=203523 RepID=UPI00037530CD|nr:MATE family efflux transporter [Longispora albida]